MKPAITKMKEWLETRVANSVLIKEWWIEAVEYARKLEAEELAQKPTAPAGLVEELQKLSDGIVPGCLSYYLKQDIDRILSRYSPQESLEKLANRKGWGTAVHLFEINGAKENNEPTEPSAREWLNSLPDVKEEK